MTYKRVLASKSTYYVRRTPPIYRVRPRNKYSYAISDFLLFSAQGAMCPPEVSYMPFIRPGDMRMRSYTISIGVPIGITLDPFLPGLLTLYLVLYAPHIGTYC